MGNVKCLYVRSLDESFCTSLRKIEDDDSLVLEPFHSTFESSAIIEIPEELYERYEKIHEELNDLRLDLLDYFLNQFPFLTS